MLCEKLGVPGLWSDLIVTVGPEERRQHLRTLLSRQRLRWYPDKVERTVRRATPCVVLDLPQENGGEVDCEMNPGMLRDQCGHGVIVADGVQANPRQQMTATAAGRGEVPVERLVLMPEQREMDLRLDVEGPDWSVDLARGRPAMDRVADAVPIRERAQLGPPVAVRPLIVLPDRRRPRFGRGAINALDPCRDPHLLGWLDRPGADCECDPFVSAHAVRRAGSVGCQVPEIHGWSSTREMVTTCVRCGDGPCLHPCGRRVVRAGRPTIPWHPGNLHRPACRRVNTLVQTSESRVRTT